MKCSRCSREITGEEAFAYEGKELCEDCLMEIGLHPKECEPWATYLATKERRGMKGAEGLTDLEKRVYEFIKNEGKTTRDKVKKNFNLSEAELDTQLTPLMHTELVKERGEGGNLYLITIG